MAIFAGKYQWDGTKKEGREPIAWFAGSYEVKLFHCDSSPNKVRHIKPFICLYAATGEGQSISANPEKFAKQICNDFSLDIERVLWVEDLLKDQNRYEVVTFISSAKMGDTTFYRTEKRSAKDSEIRLIQQELSKFGLSNE